MTAYPIGNRAIPLPYRFDDQVKNFIRDSHLANYKTGERCILLAAADSELGAWMSNYMEQIGFRAQTHPANDFVVIEFSRD